MTEVPKIVHDRLRAAALDQGLPATNAAEPNHPDPDLLTAFAEQSLSLAERDGVLEHLVLCVDCRDTVALALPAENVVAIPISPESGAIQAPAPHPSKPAPRRVFAWPSLRWAALAAGVVVVGSVFLLRPGKLNQSNQPSASQRIAPTKLPPPAAASSTTDHGAVASNPDEANLITVTPQSKKAADPRFTVQQSLAPHPAERAMLLARNNKSPRQPGGLANSPGSTALALDNSAGQETAAETNRSATATTAVSAASELSSSPANPALMANSDAPAIEKAKPAAPGTTQMNELAPSDADQQKETDSALAPALRARARASAAKLEIAASQKSATGFAQHDVAQNDFAWAINSGVLRRSEDSGQTWQDNLRADHPLLCYASRGNEIWTGGQGGTIYHSVDGGMTWVQVRPSSNGRQLASDINRIDLGSSNLASNNLGSNVTQGPAKIVLSSGNHEIWISVDDGKTWEIK
jgi:hypothetical protein